MSEIGSVIGSEMGSVAQKEMTYAEIIALLRKEIDYIDDKLIERQFNTEVVQFLLEQKESVLCGIDYCIYRSYRSYICICICKYNRRLNLHIMFNNKQVH